MNFRAELVRLGSKGACTSVASFLWPLPSPDMPDAVDVPDQKVRKLLESAEMKNLN